MKTHLIFIQKKIQDLVIFQKPTITLSEDYKYYDELNNKYIQFVDFGKITSDLVFNVPNS